MAISRKIVNVPTSQIAEEITTLMTEPARSFIALIDRDAVIDDLATLVAYPSCSFEGFDLEPVLACAEEVARMVRDTGFRDVELLDVGGKAPTVWAVHRADTERYPDAPTLLLYAHYDIQPAPVEEQGWTSDPFTLTRKDDGRYYGRGSADDKAGIVTHLHAIDAVGGLDALAHLNLIVCFEGEEECFGTLEEFIAKSPERFVADGYLISDLGNLVVGEPTLTTTLRGTAMVDVEIDTIRSAQHSGVFGGPTPDALVGLIRLLGCLWDEHGNTVIDGVKSFVWAGATYPEELFRRDVGLVKGADLVGTGPLDDRLFSRPSATIIGLDAPSVAQSANSIIPHAKARISVRFPHGQSAESVLDAIVAHLQAHEPPGMVVRYHKTSGASAFSTTLEGPLAQRFSDALAHVFGVAPSEQGGAASIPLLAALQKSAPDAEFLLFGVSDIAQSNVHGGNESVDPEELIRAIKAEAQFLAGLASEPKMIEAVGSTRVRGDATCKRST